MLNNSSYLRSENSEGSGSGGLYSYFGHIQTKIAELKNSYTDNMCGNTLYQVTHKACVPYLFQSDTATMNKNCNGK